MIIFMIILNVRFLKKKEYEEGEVKVKDRNCITLKYGESAQRKRNLNLRLIPKIPVVFHNLKS